jgi:hypothetical protein
MPLTFPKTLVFTGLLLGLVATASAGWNPLRKPLEPAQKAAEAVAKIATTEKQAKEAVARQTIPPPAKAEADKSIDGLVKEANDAVKERQTAEEDLAIKKNMLVLTLVGLVITNTLALGGFFPGRKKTQLEIKKLELEIEEKRIALGRNG